MFSHKKEFAICANLYGNLSKYHQYEGRCSNLRIHGQLAIEKMIMSIFICDIFLEFH